MTFNVFIIFILAFVSNWLINENAGKGSDAEELAFLIDGELLPDLEPSLSSCPPDPDPGPDNPPGPETYL